MQAPAGLALHQELLIVARRAGCDVREEKLGWTSVRACSPELDALFEDWKAAFVLVWTKQHLLTTGRGYPYPRLSMVLDPGFWNADGDRKAARTVLVSSTQPLARELGMKARANWMSHWGELDPIPEGQDLSGYAADCVAKLYRAADRTYQTLYEAILAIQQPSNLPTGNDQVVPRTDA